MKIKRNIALFYILRFLLPLNFTIATWSFFLTSFHNFSFGIALFFITIGQLVLSAFEVPSGIWADRFGRKQMYILGIFLTIIHLLIWCFGGSFLAFFIAAIIGGLGGAIMSGNLSAIIHDDLEQHGKEETFSKIVSHGYSISFSAKALAALVSGFLFVQNPLLPVYATLFFTVIIFIVTLFLQEPKQILSKHTDNLSHLKESLHIIKHNRILKIFFIIIFIESGAGGIYYFLQQPLLTEQGISVEHIGIFYALGALISAFGGFILQRMSKHINEMHMMYIIIGGVLIGNIFFGFFTAWASIMGLIAISLVYGYAMAYDESFLIKRVSNYQKSTFLSLLSLSMMIGYTLSNLLLSYVVDVVPMQTIFFVNIGLLCILFMFTLMYFREKVV